MAKSLAAASALINIIGRGDEKAAQAVAESFKTIDNVSSTGEASMFLRTAQAGILPALFSIGDGHMKGDANIDRLTSTRNTKKD